MDEDTETAPRVWQRRGWLNGAMTGEVDDERVVSASREIAAGAERIFEYIADPAQQPRWDGNDNLAAAAGGQRVRSVGELFITKLTTGSDRENHVVDFEEGRRIAWKPAEVGRKPPGHLWAWTLEPIDPSRTLVTHTYDWTQLNDQKRLPRARATTTDKLQASLDRLAALAERD
jgi:uncharacterized protein YndB with AHSA1/START domain